MEKSKKILRIVVPVVILLMIGGIWFWKNNPFAEKVVVNGEPLEVEYMDIPELTSRGLPALLDFGSESCGPCRAMAPDLQAIYEEMEGRAIVRYTDVWANPESGKDLPIQVVPTQLFYGADGSPFEPSEELMREIGGFILYSYRETEEHALTVHEGMLSAGQMRKILAEMGVEE